MQGKAPETTGSVVFRRYYGETYAVSQVWFAANSTEREAFRSRFEEELVRTPTATGVAVLRIAP